MIHESYKRIFQALIDNNLILLEEVGRRLELNDSTLLPIEMGFLTVAKKLRADERLTVEEIDLLRNGLTIVFKRIEGEKERLIRTEKAFNTTLTKPFDELGDLSALGSAVLRDSAVEQFYSLFSQDIDSIPVD